MVSAFLVFGKAALARWGRPLGCFHYHARLPEPVEGNPRRAGKRPTYGFGFPQRVGAVPCGGLTIMLAILREQSGTAVANRRYIRLFALLLLCASAF